MPEDSSAEMAELRATIRKLVERLCADWPEELARTGCFSREMTDAFAANGLLGVRLAEAYGGSAMSLRQYCLIQEELSRISPILSLMLSSTSGMVPMALQRHGTDEQRRRYLPRLTTGDSRTCFALTEPEGGSDAASLRTRADRSAGGYVINGRKHFLTLADAADVLLVMAVTDRSKDPKGRITAFLVDRPSPGLEVTRVDRTMGTPAWTLGEVTLTDCFVPEDNILGEIGKGFSIAMESLDEGRLNVASLCLGGASSVLERTADYVKQRQTFGAPLADRQAIQWMLADSATEIAAARSLINSALDLIERGRPVGAAGSMAKLFASEMAFQVADRAVQIHGGAGVLDNSPIGAMFRDLRLFRIGEGASEIQRMLIARSVLGRGRT